MNKLYIILFFLSFSLTTFFIDNVESVSGAPSSATATVVIGDANPVGPPEIIDNPSFNCDGAKGIVAPGARRRLLTGGGGKTNRCYPAKAIVMHYTVADKSNDLTYNWFNGGAPEPLSCLFGVDDINYNDSNQQTAAEQWLEMFDNGKKEEEYCTGTSEYNQSGISIEIAWTGRQKCVHGAEEDNSCPTEAQYQSTVDLVCYLLGQFNLPQTQIFGHNELNVGKPDPGAEWLAQFRKDVQAKCP